MTTQQSRGAGVSARKSAFDHAAEATRPSYLDIFKGLPWGVVILRLESPPDVKTFRIMEVNPAAALLTGASMEDLRGRTLADFPKLLTTSICEGCLEAIATGEPRNLGKITYGDERIREGIYSLEVFPLSDGFMGVVFESVKDRRRAEGNLRESEERFRFFLQGVQEYAIFQLDPRGNVASWNSGAQRLKGYRAEEIVGRHFSAFYLPEDVKSGKPERILEEAAVRGQTEDEGWRIRKDGSRFWANVVVTALRNSEGKLLGFAKITRDMTERHGREESLARAKEMLELRMEQRAEILARVNEELRAEIAERQRAEQQLLESLAQLRALAARIQSVREEERASIAREIHDELGQSCTAIKIDLALIGRKATKKQVQLKAKVASAMELVDQMIAKLRRIASQLRPRTLDDLGLTAALESQAEVFQSRTGIRCHVDVPREPLVLDNERATAIFRIFQESLTNVARHAQATRVEARLESAGDHLLLEVKDNGIGFDADEAKQGKSLGIVGMRERALLLDGEITIRRRLVAGTTLTLRIPLSLPIPLEQN
jgi:PAS domain S-box-containing protein